MVRQSQASSNCNKQSNVPLRFSREDRKHELSLSRYSIFGEIIELQQSTVSPFFFATTFNKEEEEKIRKYDERLSATLKKFNSCLLLLLLLLSRCAECRGQVRSNYQYSSFRLVYRLSRTRFFFSCKK